MSPAARCPGCDHVAHRNTCTRKAPSACVPLLDPATGDQLGGGGYACYRGERPPCRCPYGWCHTCRAIILGASILPLGSGEPEIDLDADLTGPAPLLVPGDLAVRHLADGTLAARRLELGEEPAGDWRPARAHAHQLAQMGAG